jgi:hypothetical protein
MQTRTYQLSRGMLLGGIIAMSLSSVGGAPNVSETLVSPAAAHFPQNKQNESPMAVNPVDANNAISGANDEYDEPDCTLNGSGSECPFDPAVGTTGVYVTHDGGQHWTQQILGWNQFGMVSDGDPVVCFGPKPDPAGGFSYAHGARAYFGCLAHSLTGPASQELLAVVYSDNGGDTWSAPIVATTYDNPVNFNDKIALWADPNPASPGFGNVYVSWTLFTGNPNLIFGKSTAFSPEPIMFARSTDGGSTFAAPRRLSSSQNNAAAGGRQGSVIRTGNDGAVYVFWAGSWKREEAIVGAASDDGGRTFSRPFLVGNVSSLDEVAGASFRVDSFPTATVDSAGNLYVAWTDVVSGHGVVTLAKSSDRGATWSLSIAANVPGRTAFYPALAASSTRVFIGFNAITEVPAGTSPGAGVVAYDAYYVLSSNSGATFSAAARISAQSSDPDSSSANSLTEQFIGDYNGAAAGPDGSFWFSWTDTRNGEPCAAVDAFRTGGPPPNLSTQCSGSFGNSDIYVARVTP